MLFKDEDNFTDQIDFEFFDDPEIQDYLTEMGITKAEFIKMESSLPGDIKELSDDNCKRQIKLNQMDIFNGELERDNKQI